MVFNSVAGRAALRLGLAVAMLGGAAVANADPVTSSLTAQYFKILNNGADPDFNIYNTPIVAPGSALGANGMPVATGGISDINGITGEITWWSPVLNANVIATGTGVVNLPYGSNMYAPNSTGSNDAAAFETALFTGSFSLANSGTVTFQLGSDDDSFIYVDGILFGQNPGVHGVSYVNFTSPTLNSGSHNIAIFYADRHEVGAYLSLSLVSEDIVITPTPGVPEPASWAMMIGGFAVAGAVMRRRSVKLRFA